MKKDLDSIPYNNPKIHNLMPIIKEKFNNNVFNELTSDTKMFKLSWKEKIDDDGESYYSKILNKEI